MQNNTSVAALKSAIEHAQKCKAAYDAATSAENSATRAMLIDAAANNDGNNHWNQASWLAIQQNFKSHDATALNLSAAMHELLAICLRLDASVLTLHEVATKNLPDSGSGLVRMHEPTKGHRTDT